MSCVWFLHLTDVHFRGRGHDAAWETVNARWQKDLRYFRKEIAQASPKFVLFTGDLGWRGGTDGEYTSGKALFESIDNVCDGRVPVFAVPGNHDVERPTPCHGWLTRVHSKKRESVFTRGTDEHNSVCALFRNWQEFSEGYLEPRLQEVPGNKRGVGLLPGDRYFQGTFGGIRIGVLCVNSAWRHLNNNVKGKLTVDLHQLPDRFNFAGLEDENDVTFLLQHHPRHWLDDPESWTNDLVSHVDVTCVGHMHRHNRTRADAEGRRCAQIQTASLYGLEPYKGPKKAKMNRQVGYTWGCIRHVDNRLSIRIWPRVLTRRDSRFRHSGNDPEKGSKLLEKACPSWPRNSPMDDLMRLTGRRLCHEKGGQLHMCRYHQDRAAVRFCEQPLERSGEIQESEGRVTLDPRVGSFIAEMNPKLAGHFGMVACQREWLLGNLQRAPAPIEGRTPAVLQTGTAGPVHYLGTVKIILEALRKVDRRVDLTTIERCCGPVMLIEEFRRAGRARGNVTRITIKGQEIPIHKSVAPLLSEYSNPSELTQELIVGSLTDPRTYRKLPGKFDVVVSHFLISFWKKEWRRLHHKFCKGLSSVVETGAVVLLAVGENESCPNVNDVHEVFEEHDFKLEHVTRTWDPYDCSPATFADLKKGKAVTVQMKESLCRYVRG